jgi:hypothetical protein
LARRAGRRLAGRRRAALLPLRGRAARRQLREDLAGARGDQGGLERLGDASRGVDHAGLAAADDAAAVDARDARRELEDAVVGRSAKAPIGTMQPPSRRRCSSRSASTQAAVGAWWIGARIFFISSSFARVSSASAPWPAAGTT